MIVNKYGNGSGGGVTPEQVEQEIQSALTPYWESGITKEYVDSADTIIYASATSRMDDVEEVVSSALNEFHTQILEVSAATSGKADAANVTANTTMKFPLWNEQGVITGTTGNNLTTTGFYLNGTRRTLIKEAASGDLGDAYAPTSPGSAGQILVSTGNGAPVWSAVTMGGVSQEYVDSAVTILQNQIDEIDEVIPTAIVDLNERVDAISAATPSIDLSGYYTSAQTEDAISAATAGKADAADMYIPQHARFPIWNTQGIITGTTGYDYYNKGNSINGITYTVPQTNNQQYSIYAPTVAGTAGDILVSKGSGAPVWSAMPAADVTKAYVDSAITQVQDQIDTIDQVASAAFVDLNEKKVESEDVKHMVRLTQAAYDQLSVKDPETFYIIVNSN